MQMYQKQPPIFSLNQSIGNNLSKLFIVSNTLRTGRMVRIWVCLTFSVPTYVGRRAADPAFFGVFTMAVATSGRDFPFGF